LADLCDQNIAGFGPTKSMPIAGQNNVLFPQSIAYMVIYVCKKCH